MAHPSLLVQSQVMLRLFIFHSSSDELSRATADLIVPENRNQGFGKETLILRFFFSADKVLMDLHDYPRFSYPALLTSKQIHSAGTGPLERAQGQSFQNKADTCVEY